MHLDGANTMMIICRRINLIETNVDFLRQKKKNVAFLQNLKHKVHILFINQKYNKFKRAIEVNYKVKL